MRQTIAIVYNYPDPAHCFKGEERAELGVLEELKAVHQALANLDYNIRLVPLLPPLEQAQKRLRALKTDIVFNLFEGFGGHPETEAIVADMIADTGMPYTGCPASSLALALDKPRTKAWLRNSEIATPDWQVLDTHNLHLFQLAYPCIVKPFGEDASHGLTSESVVRDTASLRKQVVKISRLFGGKALVEIFLNGREFNVTVMGNNKPTVLPISEIVYHVPHGMPEILTFSSKWEPESTDFEDTKVVCPADIDISLNQQITDIVLSAFKLTGCQGYARFDIRLDNERKPEIIEINPNPDISLGSGAARQAQAAGMTYEQFIHRIVLLALERLKL